MNQSYPFTILFFFFFIFILACADDDQDFLDCNASFDCGGLVNIGYPFWGNGRPQKCGGHQLFGLECLHNGTTTIFIHQQTYQVVDINTSSHAISISRPREKCSPTFEYESEAYLFYYSSTVRNLTLFYNCTTNPFPSAPLRPINFKCLVGETERDAFYAPDMLFDAAGVNDTACNTLALVPVEEKILGELLQNGVGKLDEALNDPFRVNYVTHFPCDACKRSGGKCGTNLSSLYAQFICFCRAGPRPLHCDDDKADGSRWKLKVGIGVPAFSAIAMMIFIYVIVIYTKRKILSKNDQELEAIINDYGPLPLKRYSFSDVKNMTCSFKEKLGQGGYGSVYKGKQHDGRPVAVKVLNTTKGNGEDFMNEVLSISRTSHVNIVTLLGFCLQGSKRALIYEYVCNGSLEKFIQNKSNTNTNHNHLGWDNLYRISIEIAQGLEYLHRGCKTRILHFDIKPHNILLDEDFCPKISDFGLAKLCAKKESIVSILETRGTIGYIAPELYNRNCGRVSHKSDVYSYGMMILEMVGAKNNPNINGENSSEMYFPQWIYKRLEEENDLGLNSGVMTELENEIARKMVLVGLWCIQTDPSQRPNISEVLDMLKGSIDNLQIPPRPFVASPSRPLLLDSFSSSVL